MSTMTAIALQSFLLLLALGLRAVANADVKQHQRQMEEALSHETQRANTAMRAQAEAEERAEALAFAIEVAGDIVEETNAVAEEIAMARNLVRQGNTQGGSERIGHALDRLRRVQEDFKEAAA